MNERPTPETEKAVETMRGFTKYYIESTNTSFVDASFARKLERERDEALGMVQHNAEVAERVMTENDQLRKVADELAYEFYATKTGNDEAHQAFNAYNNLPHVKERK